MDLTGFLRKKGKEVLRIAARDGARNVCVFGSCARGEGGPESDVDLLVDVGPNHSSWFPGGLVADLEELLGRPVQVITERGLNSLIRDRVLREAITISK